jgi:hypothetical protein
MTNPEQEKFSLDEGDVSLTVPSPLSLESYKDLEDRLTIILRGVKRRVLRSLVPEEVTQEKK